MSTEKQNRGIAGWRPLLRQLGLQAESAAETVARRFSQRFRPDRPLHIQVYLGFGNGQRAELSGRVLRYRPPPSDTNNGVPQAESMWANLRDSYRRFETDEEPDVRVQAQLGGQTYHTRTDKEGYFHFKLSEPAASASDNSGLVDVLVSLPDYPDAMVDGDTGILMPAAGAEFGVISDIDDTVLLTNATSVLRMMRLTLLESSASRVAFGGVGEFYRDLHRRINPFFYVSSSPWNLYEFLQDFMRLKDIVKGPLMLRDFGFDEHKVVAGPHLDHKLLQIRRVLDCYPDLPFVLIGDSGQDDPEIYKTIVTEYPTQIVCVYIRDVSGDFRDDEVRSIIQQVESLGVPMLLVPDTLAAARHAVTLGLLSADKLPAIEQAVTEDHLPHPAQDQQLT